MSNHVASRIAHRGFTLVELLITVVVIAVLAAVAYPSYLDAIRKSRRAEAMSAIAAVQQAQERFRANHTTYGNLAVPANANTLVDAPKTSSNGRYTLTATNITGTKYEVLATATGDQARDTRCAVIGAQLDGGALKYGSGATGVDWTASEPDAGRCWAK
jgi:type IV pilus assembly protein PilE